MFGKALDIDTLERRVAQLQKDIEALNDTLYSQRRAHRRLLDYLGLQEVEQPGVRLEPVGDGV